jgi:hypothetical protein
MILTVVICADLVPPAAAPGLDRSNDSENDLRLAWMLAKRRIGIRLHFGADRK